MTKITLKAENGLHARPANQLVQEAMKFEADIRLVTKEKEINAKSMLAVMTSGLVQGDVVQVMAVGSDAVLAESTIAGILESIVE